MLQKLNSCAICTHIIKNIHNTRNELTYFWAKITRVLKIWFLCGLLMHSQALS